MSERTKWHLVFVGGVALILGGALYLAISGTGGWRERRAQEQAVATAARFARRDAGVDECRTKGGVPIVSGWDGWLARCDFPCVQR